jgi:hypothetical protein
VPSHSSGRCSLRDEDLEQRHERDDQPRARRGAVDRGELAARVADVVLARAARLLGDAPRKQLGGAAEEVAQAVAAVLLAHQSQEEIEQARAPGGGRARRVAVRRRKPVQQPQARDDLLDSRQQEHEVHAHARLVRAAAHALDVLVALLEQHLEVAVVLDRLLAALLRDEGAHLVHLGEERRLVARQRRQVLQQRGVRARRREARRGEAQRLEQLVPALATRRHEGLAVEVEGIEQRIPVGARHGREPAVVVGVVEHLGDEAAQVVGVGRRGQQAPEHAAREAGAEALVGEHAGVRVEDAVHAGSELAGEVSAQGRGEVGARGDDLRQDTQPRAGCLPGFAAAGADDVHKPGEPVAAGAGRAGAQLLEQGEEGGGGVGGRVALHAGAGTGAG